jgi:hypothetical protein
MLDADEATDTPVTGIAVTTSERSLLTTTEVNTQVASLVIVQLTTSLLVRLEVVYVGLPVPEFTPLTIH